MSLSVLYWIVLAVMAVGLAGSLLPALPGPMLILAAIAVWLVATQFTAFSWPIAVAILALVLGAAAEFLGTYYGAKQLGASKWGQIGAIVGLVLGVLGFLPALPVGGPLIGVLFGPVLGAFLGEFFYRKDMELWLRARQSLQVSFGIVAGTVIGKIVEFLLALVAVVMFLLATWPAPSL